ncbi:hypothetical protein AWB78_07168 [Caballeronia calidae]|uniref:Baseplate J-like protein n=1 Tax=Caballeronia calidae TaxID=1777139 RepID=A0A158ED89_9BURK|nr:hypothetical protein [Caballeronia calidae]SAL04862.1 hypothetical protein AWB78_07168 [Caballeronia calidae]
MSRDVTLKPGMLPANLPGLPQIAYRSGSYGIFLEGMRQSVGCERHYLVDLNTRASDDPAIALLDAWAVAGDVLSFYAERIANEVYLGTALERGSIRALARLLDYELRPGKAAETWIAFTLEDAPGAPDAVPIPQGVRINSIPGPGEQMIAFETVEAMEAHPWLNAMRPQTTRMQSVDDVEAAKSVLVQGLLSDVRKGDWLLVVHGSDQNLKRVETVDPDNAAKTTRIDHETQPTFFPVVLLAQALLPPNAFVANPFGISRPFFQSEIDKVLRPQRAFEASLAQRRVTPKLLRQHLFERTPAPLPGKDGVYRFRARAAIFGHNTPAADDGASQIPDISHATASLSMMTLDQEYAELRPGTYIAFVNGGMVHVAEVRSVRTLTAQRGRLTSRTSRVGFFPALSSGWNSVSTAEVVVLLDTERLPLARLPVTAVVEGASLLLDAYYPELTEGRPVAVSGEREDLTGIEQISVHTIATITLEDGLTRIDLKSALPWALKRGTVRINANLAKATHGERGGQPIGHGDASKPGQRFRLPVIPLTHLAAQTLTGVAPVLDVVIDGVRWMGVGSLREAGPLDRVYSLSYQEDGSVDVCTGDGLNGRRVPTGVNNVVASWRKGLGSAGMVRAGQLSLLADKPQGVRSAANPLAPEGAVDGQCADDARKAAPLSVLTLGRIVALRDYADFAASFAGIAKAHAAWIWSGSSRAVFLTVAGVSGAPVPEGDLVKLRNLIGGISDPATGLTIAHFRPTWFRLEAGIALVPGYFPDAVFPRVEQVLRDRFGFAARALGQPVAKSEVISAMQAVDGVDWIDVDAFYRGDTPANRDLLAAAMPKDGRRVARLGLPEGAELLALDPAPLNFRTIT